MWITEEKRMNLNLDTRFREEDTSRDRCRTHENECQNVNERLQNFQNYGRRFKSAQRCKATHVEVSLGKIMQTKRTEDILLRVTPTRKNTEESYREKKRDLREKVNHCQFIQNYY